MTLSFRFPPQENYDCLQCGKCCSAPWTIPLETEFVDRFKDHPVSLRVIEEHGSLFQQSDTGDWTLQHHNGCGFLGSAKKCTIHSQFGAESKPRVCQLYPFTLTDTPDGVFVGTSFYCTSVEQNSGRPLSQHQPWLEAIVARGGRVYKVDEHNLCARPHVNTEWSDYLAFEARLARPQDVDRALLTCALAPEGRLEEHWRSGHLAADLKLVETLIESAGFAVLKRFLSEERPECLERIETAYLEGKPLALEEFNWTGSWADLQKFQQQAVGRPFHQQMVRWHAMQVHRKALLAPGCILDQLWTLAVVPIFVFTLAALYTWKRGHSEVRKQEFGSALEQAELYLGSNGLLLSRLAPSLSRHLLETLVEQTKG